MNVDLLALSEIADHIQAPDKATIEAAIAEIGMLRALTTPRPMSEAPRDGTPFLALTPIGFNVIWMGFDGDGDEAWVVTDNKHGPFPLRGGEPFHWWPLTEFEP